MVDVNKLFFKVLSIAARKPSRDYESVQKNVLLNHLKRSYGTELDRKYNLKKIRNIADYQRMVPVHHYDDMKELWMKEMDGVKYVTLHESIPYYAVTSGTSGKRKYIPMSRFVLKSFQTGIVRAIYSYIDKNKQKFIDNNIPFYKYHSISISGSSCLDETPSGKKYGTGSGIFNNSIPPYMRKMRIPKDKHIVDINEWDIKVDRIVEESRNKIISGASGFPSTFLYILSRMKEVYSKNEFDYFLKNFRVFYASGVNYRIYRDLIFNILGKEIDFVELYIASEGMFGYQTDHTSDVMEFLYDQTFFEFIEFEKYLQNDYSNRLLVTQLEKGRDYVILVTSGNGAFSYVIGDVIQCEDSIVPSFSIKGRTTLTINLAGEKTSINTIEQVIESLSKELGVFPGEFFVTKKLGTTLPNYFWVIEKNDAWMKYDKDFIARKLDSYLLKFNEIYGILLNVNIAPSEVEFIDSKNIRSWYCAQKKDLGQYKLPRIILNDDMVSDILNTKIGL